MKAFSSKKRKRILDVLIRKRRFGATIRQAAAAAGVSVASVFRWQARFPRFAEALAVASKQGLFFRTQSPRKREPRPTVRWHARCPLCRAKAVVKTGAGRRFWRCGCFPHCRWASWRPRHPRNCSRCGGVRYWSHTRKTIVCTRCGLRTRPRFSDVLEPWETWLPRLRNVEVC